MADEIGAHLTGHPPWERYLMVLLSAGHEHSQIDSLFFVARLHYRYSGSVDVDPDDVSYRSTTASIAGDDETQRLFRYQCAVHAVGELDRPTVKLWCDLGQGDDRRVAVCAGDPHRKMNLLAGLYGVDCAGREQHIPQ